MKVSKLIGIQKQLMERIEENHPVQQGENRFYKRLLALLVEVGECANEWRGFKFWSKNQKPSLKLLEEYVDGLHFVLELGIVLGDEFNFEDISTYKSNSIEHQFIKLYREITNLWLEREFYLELLNTYIGLGEMLGFTWEQIEQGYLEKNAVNHQRQEDGY